MGFKNVKVRILDCLASGCVLHEVRGDVDIKNLFSTGFVSLEEAAKIIGRSSGNNYSLSPHHLDKNIDVHVIKTTYAGEFWYIKWYFLDPDSVFDSFHH